MAAPTDAAEANRAAQRLPSGVGALAAIALLFLFWPVLGLLLRAPWGGLLGLLGTPEVLAALRMSLQSSVLAALLALVLGVPLAVWLAGGEGPLRRCMRILVTLPMVLPPVVAGVALLLAYGRRGVVGRPLEEWLGVVLPFHPAGVVVACTYVAIPFLVLTVEGGLRHGNPRFAAAAATLGASPWRVFRTVTLPMVAPSIGAGLLVAWARALGEFGATITFAGNLAGTTRTMPLAVYVALENRPEAAIALSLLMVAVSVVVLFAMRSRWWPAA